MKVLKRRFGMTKEEIERNIGLLPYHRLYLSVNEEVNAVRARKDLSLLKKTKTMTALRAKLAAEWKRINAEIQ
jgi:hypothetical protein